MNYIEQKKQEFEEKFPNRHPNAPFEKAVIAEAGELAAYFIRSLNGLIGHLLEKMPKEKEYLLHREEDWAADVSPGYNTALQEIRDILKKEMV